VYIFPVHDSAGSLKGVIQTEARLDEADSALSRLRLILLSGLGGSFLVACVLWFVFMKAVLHPLEEMARISRAVAEGDFSQRLTTSRRKDELQETAQTFNQMLNSVETHIANEKENQERMKRFFADVAHEFRSPLTVLTGYTDVLLRGSKDDQSALESSLEAMRSTLKRLTRLTNDLLTLSRLGAGIGLSTEDVDVNSLCQEVCEIARAVAESTEITFQPGPPVTTRGDTELLRRVLWNLLDNAIRHSPPNGRIAITVDGEQGQCSITVQDYGEGIPPEHLPHVFDRFYRVRQSHPGGTGLGLAIAKAIVEAHRGQIAIESVVGSGTTVTIVLPI
jgi:two-component system OmpR family sensor kinase